MGEWCKLLCVYYCCLSVEVIASQHLAYTFLLILLKWRKCIACLCWPLNLESNTWPHRVRPWVTYVCVFLKFQGFISCAISNDLYGPIALIFVIWNFLESVDTFDSVISQVDVSLAKVVFSFLAFGLNLSCCSDWCLGNLSFNLISRKEHSSII